MAYKRSQATSAGGDLELPIEIADGSSGEEALDQKEHSKHKEASCKAVDDVLQDVNAKGKHRRRSHEATCN